MDERMRYAKLAAVKPPSGSIAALLAINIAFLSSCGDGNAAPHGVGTATAPSAAPAWFEDVATRSGIDFLHAAGPIKHRLPETMTGGVAWLDFDDDGFLDLFLVQAGDLDADPKAPGGSKLYRNVGGRSFVDVTPFAGVSGRGYGFGCTTGDFDGDGKVDLVVTHLKGVILYRNDGDGSFTDVTAASGIADRSWCTSCAFLDYDRDGDLDLFVCRYVDWSPQIERSCRTATGEPDYCNPNNYKAPTADALYRNEGSGRFTDVSQASGVASARGNGLGVIVGDLDRDGLPDIFVANDATPDHLWINQGDGRFVERALALGCALNRGGTATASMGVASGDFDGDGSFDLVVGNMKAESISLFLGRESADFVERTLYAGLGSSTAAYTTFGVGVGDYDCDGLPDFYFANGRINKFTPYPDPLQPYAESSQLFRGLGAGKFSEVLPCGGETAAQFNVARGAAQGDYDNDGGLDVAVTRLDRPARLLRNVVPTRGHWATFKLALPSGADAVGAEARVHAGGKIRLGRVQVAASYLSANDPRIHVGLGAIKEIESVTVIWPDGKREEFGPFACDAIHVLKAGTGRPAPAGR